MTVRTERLHILVTTEEKERYQKAAKKMALPDYGGSNLSLFVRAACRAMADKVLNGKCEDCSCSKV